MAAFRTQCVAEFVFGAVRITGNLFEDQVQNALKKLCFRMRREGFWMLQLQLLYCVIQIFESIGERLTGVKPSLISYGEEAFGYTELRLYVRWHRVGVIHSDALGQTDCARDGCLG